MSEPISTNPDSKERLIGLALDGLPSPHTRRAYRAALDEFLTWSQGQRPPVLCKALVNRYKAMLIEKELAPATINQRLAAVRRLAQESADNGLLDASVASTISKVHGLRLYGVRIGRWLTSAGARELLGTPDSAQLGANGTAPSWQFCSAVACGAVAGVEITQFRIVEDRWVIADLIGSGESAEANGWRCPCTGWRVSVSITTRSLT